MAIEIIEFHLRNDSETRQKERTQLSCLICY